MPRGACGRGHVRDGGRCADEEGGRARASEQGSTEEDGEQGRRGEGGRRVREGAEGRRHLDPVPDEGGGGKAPKMSAEAPMREGRRGTGDGCGSCGGGREGGGTRARLVQTL